MRQIYQGVSTTGATIKEVEQNMKEAIALHLEGLQEEGLPVPDSTTNCEYIEA